MQCKISGIWYSLSCLAKALRQWKVRSKWNHFTEKKNNFYAASQTALCNVHNKIIAVWWETKSFAKLFFAVLCLSQLMVASASGWQETTFFCQVSFILQLLVLHPAFCVDSIGIGRWYDVALPKITGQIGIVFFKYNYIWKLQLSYFQGLQVGCIGALPEELNSGFSTAFLCH